MKMGGSSGIDHNTSLFERLVVGVQTMRDRSVAAIDSVTHPPGRNRHSVADMAKICRLLTGCPEAEIHSRIRELEDGQLLNRIEESLRVNMGIRARPEFVPRGGWLDVLKGVYALVRCTRPSTILETGVGIVGASSAFFLEALRRNGTGQLWSIDPDRFYSIYGIHCGAGIPDELKVRHTLVRGESRVAMPALLPSLRRVDIFMHDGCHTYSNMAREYRSVAPFLQPGGLLISDDVWNSAIDEFAAEHHWTVFSLKYGDTEVGFAKVIHESEL